MTIIGPDRTGLVESVARVVAEHGGNWLESRMCRLGGEFAGILRIEFPADKRQPLLDALQKLQGAGLTVVVRPGDAKAPAATGPADQTGNRRPRPPGHCPRNHRRAGARRRERRGIFQRNRQRADVRRNLVQGQRAAAIARRLRPGRVENRSGKNRRRFAGGRFVCRTRQPTSGCAAVLVGGHGQNMRHLAQPRVLKLAGIAAAGLDAGLLSPPVALVEPFRSHLVSGGGDFLLQHRPLGFCLCLAHALHPPAGLCAQAGTAARSSR